MNACETILKICLFGGASDGGIANIENHLEKIVVGENTYSDSFFVDSQGNSIYFCSKGPGRLRRQYINKLFDSEGFY